MILKLRKNKIKKEFMRFYFKNPIFWLLMMFFLFHFSFAKAGCKISVSKKIDLDAAASCIEQRYGFDSDTLRRSERKQEVPEAQVFFDVNNPKEGEKITATAVAQNFKNTAENLYYTWYIIHTDSDGKPLNTIEEGKREAMGIVARGSFDPILFGIDYSKATDDDNDGVLAPIGGLDGVGAKSTNADVKQQDANGKTTKVSVVGQYEEACYSDISRDVYDSNCLTRCYRHNFGNKFDAGQDSNSGKSLIVKCEHTFVDCDGQKVGDGSFGLKEEECWRLNPNSSDTDGDGVNDEADLAGLNQQNFTWSYRKGDRVGVIVEGTSMIPTKENTKNSYYKIMWATPGICSQKDVFIENDGCDSTADVGFNYLYAEPINTETESQIKISLATFPENPQYNEYNPEMSDWITATVNIDGDDKNPEEMYYRWDIFRCGSADYSDCVSQKVFNEDRNGSIWLTKNCQAGQSDQSLNNCAIKTNSYLEGLGAQKIEFQPQKETINNSKVYYKIIVQVKRYKNDKKTSLADIIVPVTKHDIKINLFRAIQDGEGFYHKGEKICDSGLYERLCPVYPFSALVAEVESASSDLTNFNWKINDKNIPAPYTCLFKDDSGKLNCNLSNVVYFPVTGEDKFIGGISVSAQRANGVDVDSYKFYSVNVPLVVFSSSDQKAVKALDADGKPVNYLYKAIAGSRVTFRASLMPDYLKKEEVNLEWYLGGKLVDSAFIAQRADLDIKFSQENEISFNLKGEVGVLNGLKVRLVKPISSAENILLQRAWNINNSNTLVSENEISIQNIFSQEEMLSDQQQLSSVKFFLASTAKNASEYLLMIIRMAIVLVLLWSLTFGISYAIKIPTNSKD